MKNDQNKISVRLSDEAITIHADIVWQVARSKQSAVWVATCDDLGLSTEDESLDELYSSIEENMEFLFNDLLKEGDLDKFLRERSWQYSGNTNVPDPRFSIPWRMTMTVGRRDDTISVAA